jgi:hypothetical protein
MFIPPPKEQPQQIQLELPDLSEAYYRWKLEQDKLKKPEETVIVIDLY